MWLFNISLGTLAKDGIVIDYDVYSGHGKALNNPTYCNVPDVGPIPCGDWDICGPPYTDTEHGPYILRLEPRKVTQTRRVGFLMHGKPLPPADINSGSKGCICADRVTRTRVWQSGDRWLRVVSGLPAPDLDGEISV